MRTDACNERKRGRVTQGREVEQEHGRRKKHVSPMTRMRMPAMRLKPLVDKHNAPSLQENNDHKIMERKRGSKMMKV